MVKPIFPKEQKSGGMRIANLSKFCKKNCLKVSPSACNAAVLGELGLYPLFFCYMKRCILYWLKILLMVDTRCPKASYRMLYKLDLAGRISWVTRVKHLNMALDTYG